MPFALVTLSGVSIPPMGGLPESTQVIPRCNGSRTIYLHLGRSKWTFVMPHCPRDICVAPSFAIVW